MIKPLTELRKSPSQGRSAATFAAIVEAAAHILSQHEEASLTTNSIALRAGVSIGSLYQYFPNKQAIVRALLEREVAHVEAIRPAVLDDPNAARAAVIRAAVDWWLEIYSMDPVLSARLRSLAVELLPTEELQRLGALQRDRLGRTVERVLGDTAGSRAEHAAFVVDVCLAAIADQTQRRRAQWLKSDSFRNEVRLLLDRYLT